MLKVIVILSTERQRCFTYRLRGLETILLSSFGSNCALKGGGGDTKAWHSWTLSPFGARDRRCCNLEPARPLVPIGEECATILASLPAHATAKHGAKGSDE
eukprot:GFKZ01000145.1.p1 GENE.GFKZ01000145.1~~GFKZ01000145.1.p1  ORF type:complete len:101 (+),score=1.43 GFKZ01000145.1:444-746(+)